PDLLVIRPGARNLRVAGGTIATLTDVDRAAVGRLPGVRAAISEYPVNVTARFAGSDVTTSADATQPNLPDPRMWPVARGVFFTDDDIDSFAAVAVVGQTVVDNLY